MELPRLEPLWKSLGPQGLSIVAVEATQARKGALEFITEHELTFTFLEDRADDDSVARGVYGVAAYPTTFLIDRQGRIRRFYLGFDEGDEVKLEAHIRELLVEGGAS